MDFKFKTIIQTPKQKTKFKFGYLRIFPLKKKVLIFFFGIYVLSSRKRLILNLTCLHFVLYTYSYLPIYVEGGLGFENHMDIGTCQLQRRALE